MNGILADEMGLGKTLQCIALIAYMIGMGVKGPFIVAAPLSTVPNWVAEFKRFTPMVSGNSTSIPPVADVFDHVRLLHVDMVGVLTSLFLSPFQPSDSCHSLSWFYQGKGVTS